MNVYDSTKLHPSADFLLSKEGVDSIPGRSIPSITGSLGSAHPHALGQASSIPCSMNLLDAATSFSIHSLPVSADAAATKRIHDIFLSGAQESNPVEASEATMSSRSYATDLTQTTEPANPNLLSKLTAALKVNESLAADVQILTEENAALRKASILTAGPAGLQRDFNATSINLLEELAEDKQSKDRTIISLRVTATSLEKQNRELEDQVKDMKEQISLLALAKQDTNIEKSEASATANSLHWQLEAANKQIATLSNELRMKDTTIEMLRKDVSDLREQLQRFMNANSTLTRCISEAAVSESPCGSLATVDLQGKLEMYRLMNKQYEKSMETLVTEQKATEDVLSLLMDRATSMNARLDRIEDKVVAVSRDRLVDIYRRRLESAGLYVNG